MRRQFRKRRNQWRDLDTLFKLLRDLRGARDSVRIQGDDGSVPHLCSQEEVGKEKTS